MTRALLTPAHCPFCAAQLWLLAVWLYCEACERFYMALPGRGVA